MKKILTFCLTILLIFTLNCQAKNCSFSVKNNGSKSIFVNTTEIKPNSKNSIYYDCGHPPFVYTKKDKIIHPYKPNAVLLKDQVILTFPEDFTATNRECSPCSQCPPPYGGEVDASGNCSVNCCG